MTPGSSQRLDRRAAVRSLLAGREELVVVTGLGSPSYDTMAAGDHDLNYYLWGAMGSAATVGLGLALAQPQRPVLVITGDGEQLMGIGALATIGVQRPANLTIAVLDNERYAETGMQHSHTAAGVRIDAIAAACGFGWTAEVTDNAGVEETRRRLTAFEGPSLAVLKVAPTDLERVLPPIDAVYVKHRLRLALGFRSA
ncbi:MAG TPA: thiamine pyrophosphate-dependent enzyme [Gaiellales bacterium]|nr:thiamine pyrophosphate-dependent enzyme [Gaiellales bacterium]